MDAFVNLIIIVYTGIILLHCICVENSQPYAQYTTARTTVRLPIDGVIILCYLYGPHPHTKEKKQSGYARLCLGSGLTGMKLPLTVTILVPR